MLEHLPAAIGRALASVRPGMETLAMAADGLAAPGRTIAPIGLSSDTFADGATLPDRCTDDGDGVSPALAWDGVPDGTACLALIVEDADSPTGRPLVHLIVAPIGAEVTGYPEGALDEGATGTNSFLREGWLPPDPPPGHGTHRYAFQLFALDAAVGGIGGRSAFAGAIAGHVIGMGLMVGTYGRTET